MPATPKSIHHLLWKTMFHSSFSALNTLAPTWSTCQAWTWLQSWRPGVVAQDFNGEAPPWTLICDPKKPQVETGSTSWTCSTHLNNGPIACRLDLQKMFFNYREICQKPVHGCLFLCSWLTVGSLDGLWWSSMTDTVPLNSQCLFRLLMWTIVAPKKPWWCMLNMIATDEPWWCFMVIVDSLWWFYDRNDGFTHFHQSQKGEVCFVPPESKLSTAHHLSFFIAHDLWAQLTHEGLGQSKNKVDSDWEFSWCFTVSTDR